MFFVVVKIELSLMLPLKPFTSKSIKFKLLNAGLLEPVLQSWSQNRSEPVIFAGTRDSYNGPAPAPISKHVIFTRTGFR